MPKAIITGASSGIGEALARVLASHGYTLGLAARRLDRLEALRAAFGATTCIKVMDVAQADDAQRQMAELIEELGGVDLVVLNAGTGYRNPQLDWERERLAIEVNVLGFTATANVAMKHFLSQGQGHLVSISSIAGLRGSHYAPAYHASKAYVSNYMQGMKHKVSRLRLPIVITDVKPGFVDTAMAQGEDVFWSAPVDKAARQIYAAIRRKKRNVYVTRRWRLIAWVLKTVPDALYNRFG